MNMYSGFTYIVTNPTKTVLYTGVTNNLPRRLSEHFSNRGRQISFTGKYNCYLLIYFESFRSITDAIKREKEIKGWTRIKKEALVAGQNPEWRFLNEEIMKWPPEI